MDNYRIFGLVGKKLGHSFSRDFFLKKFSSEKIRADYRNFELPAISELPHLLASEPGLCGFNVTIPYKRSIIPLLHSVDPVALSLGAVNTVRRMPDGHLCGFNTDAPAFAESLRRFIGGGPAPERALVLGTGGAAQAVCAVLAGMGIGITSVSRTAAPGRITYAEAVGPVVAAHRLIVNCTPLGMWPHTDAAPLIDYSALTSAHLCFDLVYNPDPTLFMLKASEAGARTRSGLEMLRLQAQGAWRIWCGDSPASIDYSRFR